MSRALLFVALFAAALLCVSVDAYVYPLPATAASATTLGGRTRTLGGNVPRGFNANNDANTLMSTPAYTAWGAKISTARYAHNAVGGTFTRIANEDCAEILNTRLIDGDQAIPGAANARGLRLHRGTFQGMVALAVVDKGLDTQGPARNIYWTISSNAQPGVADYAAYAATNMDMNRWQAVQPIGHTDVWVFVDPYANLAGLNTSPSDLCLAHNVPGGNAAAHPVDPSPVYAATIAVPALATIGGIAGFPPTHPVTGLVWDQSQLRTYWPTWKTQQRNAAEVAARTQGAAFCLRSHAFDEFRYAQQAGMPNGGGGVVRTSYARINALGNVIEGSNVNGANPVGIPTCNCAGSRLAAFLHHRGVFTAPGPYVALVQRLYSKGYPESDSSYHERTAHRTAYEARLKANDRVRCFSEARANANANRNPGYEVNGRGFYDARPTAASCTTCQVQIQLMYGNSVAVACGNGIALAAAQQAGEHAWANLPPAEQSLSFVSLDEQICTEADAEADHAVTHSDATKDDQHAQLLQHNQSPMRALRRRIKGE